MGVISLIDYNWLTAWGSTSYVNVQESYEWIFVVDFLVSYQWWNVTEYIYYCTVLVYHSVNATQLIHWLRCRTFSQQTFCYIHCTAGQTQVQHQDSTKFNRNKTGWNDLPILFYSVYWIVQRQDNLVFNPYQLHSFL